jgi:putative heme-binding domain-containing protein
MIHERIKQSFLVVAAGSALFFFWLSASAAEDLKKPKPASEKDIQEGGVLFRQNCVGCHGPRARGGRGPDLTDDRWLHGSRDEDLFRVIRQGVRGTTMKELSVLISDEKLWKIIAFVRSLARTAGDPEWQPYLAGDPAAGKQLFFDDKGKANCVKCHAVDGAGGNLGPALSHIAAQRSPKHLMDSMVLPSADIDPSFETVVVMTRAGRVFTGIRVNEDNFSIQLREQETARFLSFYKHELQDIQDQKKSLMPENLVEQVTVKELHDLFAYLMTLDGRPAPPAKGK